MKFKRNIGINRRRLLNGLATIGVFTAPLAVQSSLPSAQAQVINGQNYYYYNRNDDDQYYGDRNGRRGNWNRPVRPSAPTIPQPGVLPPDFYQPGVTPPGQYPPGMAPSGAPFPVPAPNYGSGRDWNGRDWRNRDWRDRDWRNDRRRNRDRDDGDWRDRDNRGRWNDNGNWNNGNWNNGNWSSGNNGNWNNENRPDNQGQLYSLQGRVIQDLAGNSFRIRTANGKELRVHLQTRETGRLDAGDWIQVYGHESGGIFHARSLRILRDG